MCTQSNWLFQLCGHRAFAKFDNCEYFGKGCFGAPGRHIDWPVEDLCNDCKIKPLDPNPNPNPDPYGGSKERARKNKKA
ncbi:hypothetical protein QBC41DRAFT_321933 [Cercophora samala]|uniref:Uncharacterized protein n=1 Tax=Cercophora samala TaxID=330535 RepID=A0AA39ZCP3_9PEZI|nr:hypothetical protein QBC41DRAFT_321933 [Cercophora samala]